MFIFHTRRRKQSSFFHLPFCSPPIRQSNRRAPQPAAQKNRHTLRRDHSKNKRSELSQTGCSGEAKWRQKERPPPLLEFVPSAVAWRPRLGELQECNKPHRPPQLTFATVFQRS